MRSAGVASLADIEALEQSAPLEERLPAATVWQLIERSAGAHGERPALSFLPSGDPAEAALCWSYSEFAAEIRRIANLLHRLGVQPGEGVGLLLPNLPHSYFAMYGAEVAAVACPINPLLGTAQIAGILNEAACVALVLPDARQMPTLWEKARQALAAAPGVRHVLCVGDPDSAPFPRGLPVLNLLQQAVAEPADHLVFVPATNPDAIIARFHTGGTTGAPKVANHHQRNHVYQAWAFAMLAGLDEHDVFLLGLPLFHVHAAIPASLGPFSVGAHVVLLGPEGFRHAAIRNGFWQLVERFRATLFSAVPTVYSQLLELPVDKRRVASLRLAICGSAPLPVAVQREFEQRTGLAILEGYGLTEGTCVSSMNPLRGERRNGSIGLRLPYQPMKIAQLDEAGRWQRDCECGEKGALLVSGPNVFAGYTDPRLTREAFAAPGWLNTGDLARKDAQGYFWLCGRAKDLIKRSGHSIDPRVIEEALHTHPSIAVAAVVGMPDARAGELPVAYVELRPGTQADEAALRDHCRATVGDPVAVPVQVRIVERLPLTVVGKIDKVRLRAWAAETTL